MLTNSKNMKNQLFFLMMLTLIVMLPNAMAQSEYVPSWVKNNAGWWSDGQIPDSAFIDGIEFLINEKIILLNSNSETISNSEFIPSWVKNNAGWWSDGQIPDSAFIDGIEFLINNGIIHVEIHSEYELHNYLIDWDELVNDSKFAFDGSVELTTQFFMDADFPLATRYDVKQDGFAHVGTYDFLSSGIGMYRITGDEIYLDQSRRTANFIEDHILTDRNLIYHYNPFTGLGITGYHTNQEIVDDIAHLALLDSSYDNLVEKMADEIILLEINNETNLFYTNMDDYALPANTDMYLPYGGAAGLESLLIAYEVTSNEIYLEQVKKTLLAYWDLRNKDTNLVPSMINADTNEIKQKFMQQYGAGIFLKILLHYYYLTDDPEILSIMKIYSDAVIEHFWDGKTWNYRVNDDGSILSKSIEANFGKLDDALFLLYDIDPVLFKNSYKFGKLDYDNSLNDKLIITNNLVIHSVKDDGSKDSPQSMMNYAFLINQNVAARLYIDTGNEKYISDFHEFYDSVITNHKHEFGYIHGIDAYSKELTELGVILNQRAPANIANKINLTFMPSENVRIIWTIIGNHELSEPFLTVFTDSGRFNNIEFDYNNRLIDMKTVYGEGTITFADEIESVLVDGVKYQNFNNYTLDTLDGKHRYQVYLTPYDGFIHALEE